MSSDAAVDEAAPPPPAPLVLPSDNDEEGNKNLSSPVESPTNQQAQPREGEAVQSSSLASSQQSPKKKKTARIAPDTAEPQPQLLSPKNAASSFGAAPGAAQEEVVDHDGVSDMAVGLVSSPSMKLMSSPSGVFRRTGSFGILSPTLSSGTFSSPAAGAGGGGSGDFAAAGGGGNSSSGNFGSAVGGSSADVEEAMEGVKDAERPSQPLIPRRGTVAFNFFAPSNPRALSIIGKVERKEQHNRNVLEVYLRNDYATKIIKIVHERRLLRLYLYMERKLYLLTSSQEMWWRSGIITWELLDRFDYEQELYRLHIKILHILGMHEFQRHFVEQYRFMMCHEHAKELFAVERQENRERRFICRDRDVAQQWFDYDFFQNMQRSVEEELLRMLANLHNGMSFELSELAQRHRISSVDYYTELALDVFHGHLVSETIPRLHSCLLEEMEFEVKKFIRQHDALRVLQPVGRGYSRRCWFALEAPKIRSRRGAILIHRIIKGFFTRRFMFNKWPRRLQLTFAARQKKKEEEEEQRAKKNTAAATAGDDSAATSPSTKRTGHGKEDEEASVQPTQLPTESTKEQQQPEKKAQDEDDDTAAAAADDKSSAEAKPATSSGDRVDDECRKDSDGEAAATQEEEQPDAEREEEQARRQQEEAAHAVDVLQRCTRAYQTRSWAGHVLNFTNATLQLRRPRILEEIYAEQSTVVEDETLECLSSLGNEQFSSLIDMQLKLTTAASNLAGDKLGADQFSDRCSMLLEMEACLRSAVSHEERAGLAEVNQRQEQFALEGQEDCDRRFAQHVSDLTFFHEISSESFWSFKSAAQAESLRLHGDALAGFELELGETTARIQIASTDYYVSLTAEVIASIIPSMHATLLEERNLELSHLQQTSEMELSELAQRHRISSVDYYTELALEVFHGHLVSETIPGLHSCLLEEMEFEVKKFLNLRKSALCLQPIGRGFLHRNTLVAAVRQISEKQSSVVIHAVVKGFFMRHAVFYRLSRRQQMTFTAQSKERNRNKRKSNSAMQEEERNKKESNEAAPPQPAAAAAAATTPRQHHDDPATPR